jgi:uncharacterized protein YecT (DUF1311 family)
MEVNMKWMPLVFLMMTVPAWPEDASDCKNPTTDPEQLHCAGVGFENADKALNAIWPNIKANAEVRDKQPTNIPEGTTPYRDALLASQRAWLSYCEAECAWRAFESHGGTAEHVIDEDCQTELTLNRIKELRATLTWAR